MLRACPLCAEMIQPAAVKCRFCGASVGKVSADDEGSPSKMGQEESVRIPTRRTPRKTWAIAFVLAFIVVCGVGVGFAHIRASRVPPADEAFWRAYSSIFTSKVLKQIRACPNGLAVDQHEVSATLVKTAQDPRRVLQNVIALLHRLVERHGSPEAPAVCHFRYRVLGRVGHPDGNGRWHVPVELLPTR